MTYYATDKNRENANNNTILNRENIHWPEMCRGNRHKFLIYSNLLSHYEWDQNCGANNLPESHHFKAQGKPDTGKSFVINHLRNITKLIMKSNLYDTAIALTECAASLITRINITIL